MTKLAPVILFFGLFWTAIVGAFDVFLGSSILASLRAETFATTEGRITHSAVSRLDGDDGPTYGVDIRYTYDADRQTFEGATYRYSAFHSSDSEWAHAIVNAHPKGAAVTVYYDPADPAASVLVPGIDGADLFMLLFLTPFNVVMVGIWWFVGAAGWDWWQGRQRPLAPSFRDVAGLHVRLAGMPWAAAGFAALGGAAFAGVFIVAFTAGVHPSTDFMTGIWLLVFGAGVATAVHLRRKERAGDYDLLIGDREVALPLTFGRTRRERINKRDITGIAVEKVTKDKDAKTYEIRLLKREGGHFTVADRSDDLEADKLARWLGEEIGVGRR